MKESYIKPVVKIDEFSVCEVLTTSEEVSSPSLEGSGEVTVID